MSRLPSWIENYRTLPRPVLHFTAAQFMVNLITATQFLLLNLYLKNLGMDDPSIAGLTSYRFLAALLLAIPAGLWLRGKPLKPILLIGSILYPIATLASLEAVRFGMIPLATAAFLSTGVAILMINIASLPMALRLAPDNQTSETLSLLFASWAAASICGGLFSTLVQSLNTATIGGVVLHFDEHATLVLVTMIACSAPWFYAKLPNIRAPISKHRHWLHIPSHDIPLITRAVFPTLFIATGAGLSIQFLNLFFSHVHDLSSRDYSAASMFSNVLVLFAGLILPEIKRRFGWRRAIIGVQTLSVILLVTMGLTELVSALSWALPVAIFCFIMRQPLMNMAAPATSELTMRFVGDHNRELMSAFNGAIWSGSWWLAARIFQQLRAHDLPYWQILMVTGGLYMVGTISYLGLIRKLEAQGIKQALPLLPAA